MYIKMTEKKQPQSSRGQIRRRDYVTAPLIFLTGNSAESAGRHLRQWAIIRTGSKASREMREPQGPDRSGLARGKKAGEEKARFLARESPPSIRRPLRCSDTLVSLQPTHSRTSYSSASSYTLRICDESDENLLQSLYILVTSAIAHT